MREAMQKLIESNGDKSTRDSVCEVHGAYVENGWNLSGDRIVWIGCQVCKKIKNDEIEAERLKEKQIEELERFEKRLKRAGIPERFRNKTFDTYFADTDAKRTSLKVAVEFVENFDENYKNGLTVIFSGKAGTGKSHLAIAIAKSIMPRYTALYANALDLVRMVRDTWRKDADKSELEVLDMLGSVGLLVIDEVGVQYGTDSEQMLMFDIINRRYRDLKPMILLTNLGTSGLSEYLTERSYDRLRENGKWVSFDWASYRSKDNQ